MANPASVESSCVTVIQTEEEKKAIEDKARETEQLVKRYHEEAERRRNEADELKREVVHAK